MDFYHALAITLAVTATIFFIMSIVVAVMLAVFLRSAWAVLKKIDVATDKVTATAGQWADKMAPAALAFALRTAMKKFRKKASL